MAESPSTRDIFLARRGDRDALDRLLGRHQDRLTRFVRMRVGRGLRGRVRTSDLLQSSLYEVVASIDDFRGETENEFLAWAGRIVDNTVRDKARFFEAAKRAGEVPITSGSILTGDAPSPSSWAAMREEADIVGQALDALSDDHREVLLMKFSEKLNHREIAEVLDRSEEATRILLWRARAALALELERRRGSAGGKSEESP